MLKIKLLPLGKKHAIFYRVVVREENSKLTSTPTAVLGTYDPRLKKFQVDRPLFESWLAKGAQPTTTIRNLWTTSSNS